VGFFTVRLGPGSDDAQRDAIDTIVHQRRGNATWRSSVRAGRTYGLVEISGDPSLAAAPAGTVIYDAPIIALAVYPLIAEALPNLMAALSGAGKPGGVLSCEPCADGIVVEWDPQRTAAPIVLGLIDVELRRFSSGRTNELLSPLAPETVAAVAADGLQAPDVTTDRILETLLERAGLPGRV